MTYHDWRGVEAEGGDYPGPYNMLTMSGKVAPIHEQIREELGSEVPVSIYSDFIVGEDKKAFHVETRLVLADPEQDAEALVESAKFLAQRYWASGRVVIDTPSTYEVAKAALS